jgi:hypothetical protein
MITSRILAIAAIVEIVSVFSGFLLVMWGILPKLNLVENATKITVMLAITYIYILYISPQYFFNDSFASRGLGEWKTGFIRIDNIVASVKIYGTICLVNCFLIVVLVLAFKPLALKKISWVAFNVKLGFYFFSALAQQLVFTGWLCLRLKQAVSLFGIEQTRKFTPKYLVAIAAALIAFCFHAPNITLMMITLLLGFAFALASYSTPNIFVMVCSHAVIGTFLHRIACLYMKTGPYYGQKDVHFFRIIFPRIQEMIGNLY